MSELPNAEDLKKQREEEHANLKSFFTTDWYGRYESDVPCGRIVLWKHGVQEIALMEPKVIPNTMSVTFKEAKTFKLEIIVAVEDLARLLQETAEMVAEDNTSFKFEHAFVVTRSMKE